MFEFEFVPRPGLTSGVGGGGGAALAVAIATSFLRGQSNAQGGSQASDTTKFKNFATLGQIPVHQAATVSGSGESTIFAWVDYEIEAPILKGESSCLNTGLAGDGTPTSTNWGIVRATDEEGLFDGAEDYRIIKDALAGQPIVEFLPITGGTWLHENRALRNMLRAWRNGLGEAPGMQFAIWWQGEADTNSATDGSTTNTDEFNNYVARFETIYAFHEAQYGTQPPWFLVEIAELDIYDEFFNTDILTDLARYKVNLDASGNLTSITDLANGSHANRYIVSHTFKDVLHASPDELMMIGQGIGDALKQIHGGSGLTTSYPMSLLPPVFTTNPAVSGSPTASSATFTATTAGLPTLYAAAVAAGAAAPSVAQVVAGTGGGIVAAGNGSLPLHASGSVTVNGLAGATSYDFYFVAQSGGVNSALKSVLNITTASSAETAFDPAFHSTSLSYTNSDRTVTRTDTTGLRAARSLGGKTSGKHYAEIVPATATASFVGVGTTGYTTIGAGTLGVHRCGMVAANMRSSDGVGGDVSTAMGAQATAGTIVRIAVDIDNDLIWVKLNAGNWNNNGSADPATGAGGLSIVSMTGAIYLGATMGTTASSGFTIRTSGDAGYSLPSGFSTWLT